MRLARANRGQMPSWLTSPILVIALVGLLGLGLHAGEIAYANSHVRRLDGPHSSPPARPSVAAFDFVSMTPQELEEHRFARAQIMEGDRMILEGDRMREVLDGQSGLDGRRIDNSATRKSGVDRTLRGQRLVSEGETRLRSLLENVAGRKAENHRRMQEAYFYNWTGHDGRRIRASFVELAGETVTVLRDDGRMFRFSLSLLLPGSRAYAELMGAGHEFDQVGLLGAIGRGDFAAVELYFKSGLPMGEPFMGEALALAITVGSEIIVQHLLDYGADPVACGPTGLRPLSEAVVREKRNLAAMLVAAGASPLDRDITNEGLSPLTRALLQGDREILDIFSRVNMEPTKRTRQAMNLILERTFSSIPPRVIDAILDLDRGEELDDEETARTELFLAGQRLSVEGFLHALEASSPLIYLRWYCRAGLTAAAVEFEWSKLKQLIRGQPQIVGQALIDCADLPPKKRAELRLLHAGYEVTPDSMLTAVSRNDLDAINDFLLVGVSPKDQGSDGTMVLVHALRQNVPEIERILLGSVAIGEIELARLRLEAGGDYLLDPLRAQIELQAAGVSFEREFFIRAIRDGQVQLLELFIRAGAAGEFDLSPRSPIWVASIKENNPVVQELLLLAATLDLKQELLLRIRHLDIRHLEQVTPRPPLP